MFNIYIHTVPHREQRYDTLGDWMWRGDGTLEIAVSEMGDWRYEFLVALHEVVEVIWCRFNGVSQKSVDSFDIEFEKARKKGNEDEPGDDPKAPYHGGHNFGTAAERMMAAVLGVKWKKYEEACLRVSGEYKNR